MQMSMLFFSWLVLLAVSNPLDRIHEYLNIFSVGTTWEAMSLFQDIAEFEPVTWNEYIQSVDSLESLGILSVDREAALLQPVTVTLRIREDMPQMQLAPAPVIWWWMHPAYASPSAFLVFRPGIFLTASKVFAPT